MPAWRAWLRKFPRRPTSPAPFDLLDAVGLDDFATRRADQLSGGQRQRVGIARALMQDPDLMLADEPTSSLDPKTSVEIMELIAQLASARGIPVIINIHNVELAKRFASRIIGMADGQRRVRRPAVEQLTEAISRRSTAARAGSTSGMTRERRRRQPLPGQTLCPSTGRDASASSAWRCT